MFAVLVLSLKAVLPVKQPKQSILDSSIVSAFKSEGVQISGLKKFMT